MLRSQANLLLSISRVTEINKGRKTAGIDGQKVLTNPGREKLYQIAKYLLQIKQAIASWIKDIQFLLKT